VEHPSLCCVSDEEDKKSLITSAPEFLSPLQPVSGSIEPGSSSSRRRIWPVGRTFRASSSRLLHRAGRITRQDADATADASDGKYVEQRADDTETEEASDGDEPQIQKCKNRAGPRSGKQPILREKEVARIARDPEADSGNGDEEASAGRQRARASPDGHAEQRFRPAENSSSWAGS